MKEQTRTTISISPEIYAAAMKLAEVEKRNFSNLCEVALEEFLHLRTPVEEAEVAAAILEAKAAGVDVIKTLKRALRKKSS